MKAPIRVLILLLCLVTVLWGCQRSTTVILPPETAPTAASREIPNTATTEPSSAPATEPTTEPSTAPTADPTEAVTTDLTDGPGSVPAETPTVTPATEATAAPATEPATDPITEPTMAPTTVPATEPEPTQHPVYDISGHSVGSLEYGLLDAINQKRAEAELPALTMDSTLCALAVIRAYECTESFTHTRPDGRGAYTVLSDHGYYIWSSLDERIHYGSSGLSAGTIVKGWMYNEAFSASILSGDFTHIGIGVYDNGGTTYIVCLFAG